MDASRYVSTTRGASNTPDGLSYGQRPSARREPPQPCFSPPSSRKHLNAPLPPAPSSSNPSSPSGAPRLSLGLGPSEPITFDSPTSPSTFDRRASIPRHNSEDSNDPTYPTKPAYRDIPDAIPLTDYRNTSDPEMDRAGVRQPRIRRDFRRAPRDLPVETYEKPAPARFGGARGYLRDKYETHFKISRHTPFFCYLITLIQICVFIAELSTNTKLTNSPIQTQPVFNPMIGPSPYVLINMGARFVPCMRSVPSVQDAPSPPGWACPNTTTYDVDSPTMQCKLSELCGFPKTPVPDPIANGSLTTGPMPNQWFRFIIPMFLHAGFIHIAFNLLLQMLIGRDMEKKIGAFRFGIVYFASGIFGFILGGNFAPAGVASTGASGSLFGVIALELIDLAYTWSDRTAPGRDLFFLLVDILISFALGLLPGLDNFSHIGGFAMGLLLGVFILHSPNALRRRILAEPYSPLSTARAAEAEGWNEAKAFVRQPVGFFKGRKPFWWVWWIFRMVMVGGAVILFIALLRNFYVNRVSCSWCKYLSCLPVPGWCDLGNLDFKNQTTTTASKSVIKNLAKPLANQAVHKAPKLF